MKPTKAKPMGLVNKWAVVFTDWKHLHRTELSGPFAMRDEAEAYAEALPFPAVVVMLVRPESGG